MRGLTFEQAAQLKDEVRRDVQFTVPPGSVNILKRLPGYQDFNPAREVLRMLRCGFGLKDAPRLWNKILRQVLSQLGMTPLQSDPQLFVWHVEEPQNHSGESSLSSSGGLKGSGNGRQRTGGDSSHTASVKAGGEDLPRGASKRLVLILSTHVDDFKGAGEAWYRQRLIEGLEKAFSTLKVKSWNFECVGVMDEQDQVTQ